MKIFRMITLTILTTTSMLAARPGYGEPVASNAKIRDLCVNNSLQITADAQRIMDEQNQEQQRKCFGSEGVDAIFVPGTVRYTMANGLVGTLPGCFFQATECKFRGLAVRLQHAFDIQEQIDQTRARSEFGDIIGWIGTLNDLNSDDCQYSTQVFFADATNPTIPLEYCAQNTPIPRGPSGN